MHGDDIAGLNARYHFCRIKRTKSELLLFPVPNKNKNYIKYVEENNKRIITEALLDLSKYPGSSNVVIEYIDTFDYLPNADLIVARGYIDMANGFGAKSRYKFHFHIKKFAVMERWFSQFMGDKKY